MTIKYKEEMSKTITINNGGRYDDQSYTDERHYHYSNPSASGQESTDSEPNEQEKVPLRLRLRLVEALLEGCGASTKNTDRIKLCRLMAFATGTTEGYVKKIYTERHIDVSASNNQKGFVQLRQLLADADLNLGI